MKPSIIAYKTRLLLLAGALFIAPSTSAFAQTPDTATLLNRIKQLENQVQTMSRALYRNDADAKAALSAGGSADTATAAANTEVRMSAIEDQQRQITGQLEKMGYDIQQMKDQLTRMQTDSEQRLQQIEKGTLPSSLTPSETSASSASGTLGTINSGSTGNSGPAEALYEEAFSAVRETQYDTAETKFKQFLGAYPKHPLSANAEYWLGETYYVRGNYKSAAKSFAQGYQDFPKSPKAADSLYKLGLSLSKMGKKDDACLSLRQLQKDFQGEGGPLQRKAQEEIKKLGCP